MYYVVLLSALLLAGNGFVEAEEFTITLDSEDKYNVTWSFDGLAADNYITFTIRAETTGWVGLGFSPNGGMAGADIAVAWVTSDGDAFLEDMHATANGLPSTDGSNDLELISSSEADGITTISFKRKIVTCDDGEDNDIKSSTTRLIFAYGSSDPANNALSSGDYHNSNRGAKSIYLLDPKTSASALPDDALTWDLLTNSYEIPNTDTTYYCSFFDPPVLDDIHHIVSVDPIITPGNEGLVHHILVYACWGVADEHLRGNNKTEGVCFGEEMPEFFGSCRSVFVAWAIGGETFYAPEEAGFPIGGTEAEGSPQYFLMETHYDNPQLISGRSDTSGIRLTYTPTRRTQSAGLLQIGYINGIFVPPNTDEFNLVAYCGSTCTNQWIPEDGITIFGYTLHAHLLGVGIKVEQFRGGDSIGIFAEDEAYDFNYQDTRSFNSYKKVMPGDTLKITCNYKSDRSVTTYGGEASSAEMCLAFLMYYPRQDIANCESTPTYMVDTNHELWSELAVTAETYAGGVFVRIEDTFAGVSSWTSALKSRAQEIAYSSTQYTNCVQTGGEEFPVDQYALISPDDFKDGDYDDDVCSEIKEGGNSATSLQTGFLATVILTATARLLA